MRTRIFSVLALVALLWPANAQAGTITVQNVFYFTGVASGYVFDGDHFAQVLGSATMSDGTGLGALDGQTFEAYCVDIDGPIDFRETAADAPLVYNAEVGEMIDWAAPDALNTEEAGRRAAWLYNTYATTFTSTQLLERTALQMAIWEVLYDTTPNVIESPVAGRFAVSAGNPDVALKTTEYLTLMLADTAGVNASNAAWLQLSTADGGYVQDFIGPMAANTPVPEPGAGLLLGMGFTALAAFRSRKSLFSRA